MKRIIQLSVCFLLLTSAQIRAEDAYVFEGRIASVPGQLSSVVQEGWVLSGSFLWGQANDKGSLANGIAEGEFTVDAYRNVHLSGISTGSAGSLEYVDDDPNASGRDFIGINIPFATGVSEGYVLSWIQLWFFNSSGNMVRTSNVNPGLVPDHWDSGWFRMIFTSPDTNDAIFVEGEITIFDQWDGYFDEPDPIDELNAWRSIVRQMGQDMTSKDTQISDLVKDLAAAEKRISGLRTMVDLMVEERKRLEEEIGQLRQLDSADSAKEKISDLEASIILKETELESEKVRNNELAEALSAAYGSQVSLERTIEQMQVKITLLEEQVAQIPPDTVTKTLTRNIQMEESYEEAVLVDTDPVEDIQVFAPPAVEVKPEKRRRVRMPRKYR